ncbi:hypothetical protein J1N35_003851 [Gossypium stocksii]|uniref:HMA domain-containing protein n=1 Tax=Gossypium stocksii TaxID=47602 RepID=A0A9D3WB69_9ROSI|nr:hypothetical protein J1N35_003851 [Gossypium stocksii]
MMNKVSEILLNLSPNCGNLSTLLLKKNRSLKRISESFFQHMYSLNILDLSYTGIKQLPNSVSNLETLNALVLRGCYNLNYVPSLEKLKALQKLDLRGTGIKKVPKGLEMLTNLTYLNLCTESLKELPIAILPGLSRLQCLILYVKSACVKMNRSELARLRKLEVFEGRFNELIDFNAYTKSIQGQQLTSYLLVMAPLGEDIDYVFRFKVNKHCDGCVYRLRKSLSKFPAVKTVSLTGEKKMIVEATLEVSGKLEMGPTNIAANLMKRRLGDVQLMDEWWEPPLLPMKDVILSGCPIGREDPAELPSDVMSLRIFRCHNIRSLSDMPFFQQTNELGFCSIHDCRGIESVLDLSSSQSCTPFENLELLWLENLDNLHVLVKVAEASTVSTLSSQVLLNTGCLYHSKASKAVGLTIKSWRNKSTQLITLPSFFCGGSIFDEVLPRMHPSLVVLSVINELQFGFNVIGLLML